MSLSGNITQVVNALTTPITIPRNVTAGGLSEAKNAYQLAKALDPEIGTMAEWIASLEGVPGEPGVEGEPGPAGEVGPAQPIGLVCGLAIALG